MCSCIDASVAGMALLDSSSASPDSWPSAKVPRTGPGALPGQSARARVYGSAAPPPTLAPSTSPRLGCQGRRLLRAVPERVNALGAPPLGMMSPPRRPIRAGCFSKKGVRPSRQSGEVGVREEEEE